DLATPAIGGVVAEKAVLVTRLARRDTDARARGIQTATEVRGPGTGHRSTFYLLGAGGLKVGKLALAAGVLWGAVSGVNRDPDGTASLGVAGKAALTQAAARIQHVVNLFQAAAFAAPEHDER